MIRDIGTKLTALVAAIVVATTGATAEQPSQAGQAPFAGLYTIEYVTTSRDEHSIWMYWAAESFTLGYGRYITPPTTERDHPIERATIEFTCRVDGRSHGFAGPHPLTVWVNVPRHPESPDTSEIIDPRSWWRALTGRQRETWLVEAQVEWPAGRVQFTTEVENTLVAYGFRRPELRAQLPTEPFLTAAAEGDRVSLTAQGERFDLKVELAPTNDLRQAAQAIKRHC